jgi:hypothetical protein
VVFSAALNTKQTILTNILDFNPRKKLVKCCIWSVAVYGAENWTLRKVYQKYLYSFEMWCWRRMERISWTDRVEIRKYYMESRETGISYMQYRERILIGLVTF